MASYRVLRKLYSINVPQESPNEVPKSSNKPGVVPSTVSGSQASQMKNLSESRRMQNQLVLSNMKTKRQDMINQKARMELLGKERKEQNKQIIESQKVEQERTNNQNKLQVSINRQNRPDLGKVMPANLVKTRTTPSETKSVK